MNMRVKLLFVLMFLLYSTIVQSQGMQIVPNGGISKALGDGSEYWKLGYNLGASVFKKSSSAITFGGRIAYNRLSPNGDEWIKMASGIPAGPYGETYDYKLESTSGGLSIIEIIPSLMISMTNNKQSKTKFNIIGGAGLYSMSSDIKVEGSYESQYVQSTVEIEPESESETKFGVQFGILLAIEDKFVIQPLYNIVFTEEESTKYFTLNVGYKLNR